MTGTLNGVKRNSQLFNEETPLEELNWEKFNTQPKAMYDSIREKIADIKKNKGSK